MTPRVTIGLPVYNGERFLEASIRSVLEQGYTDLELVISDNGSSDATAEIIQRFATADPRVRVLTNDRNRGAAWNYNNVLAHATGEFFRWHAHDDLLHPDLIERLVTELDGDPDAILAHSWTSFIDDDGREEQVFEDDLGVTSDVPADRLESCVRRLTFCNAVFGLIRRAPLDRTARIGAFPASDVPLLYELAVNGRFVVVPEALFERRPGASIKANRSTRSLAAWFGPESSGRRLPGLVLAIATVKAILRAPISLRQRAAAVVRFARVWPREYLRRLYRRRQRRRQVP